MTFRFVPAVVLFLAGAAACLGAGPKVPEGALLSNRAWPRPSTLREWTADIMRIEGLEKATETAQAKAFFTWNRLFCRMAVGGMIQAHEGVYNQEKSVLDPHKNLFVYGWGFCDTCSRAAEAAWSEFKGDAHAAERVITQHEDGGFHTMYRLRLDGKHGAFDPRYGYYLVAEDSASARILDWAEVGDDANLIRNKSYRHRSRPYFEIGRIEWERALLIQPTYFASQDAWEKAGAPHESVFGDPKHVFGSSYHDMHFRLPRGTTITTILGQLGAELYRPEGARAKREFPFLSSGRFYRVTDASHDGNWPKSDPNYAKAEPYLSNVPKGEGYDAELEGGRTIGQAWGSVTYAPELSSDDLEDVLAPGSTLELAEAAPYLRAKDPVGGGSAILDFYSPYVLVDGDLEATLEGPEGGTSIELRTLLAKATFDEADQWSRWQRLSTASSTVRAELGRPRFNGKDVSIHGVYRFQIRVSVKGDPQGRPAGLSALRWKLSFETSIMSIPPLFSGKNKMRFEVADASRLRAPVTVTYEYESATGERRHRQRIPPDAFEGNVADYEIDAEGLVRCRSVSIRY
ncbi:MAG: hypothetical protein U5J83_18550 [Bryobacterales bacterium]|nr:hypothetical protein [Bryobacterales bacterium]